MGLSQKIAVTGKSKEEIQNPKKEVKKGSGKE